ncbi:hypothetical protein SAMN05428988_3173 [Chitinophaga sp. YR573]|uniref:hypothetical protein n=1 Tax=Chitinophaga sp. YR573 TaxID=1881040 RepID=UPI0008C4E955|nr:hypothetical protein [Chitinophaga sp. YR573]SEW21109.1 hypothetical protein SAMN05428988_3173 [Chitinophaga sp. YR573]
MKLIEEYNHLVKSVKATAKASGNKINNEDISKRLGFTRTYFSGLLGGSVAIKEKHIKDFKAHFSKELSADIKPAPAGNPLDRAEATIKALLHRFAKLEAKVTNRPIQEILDELDDDIILQLNDLNKDN